MSALAKPMVHSTTAIAATASMVNIEEVKAISKVDLPAVGNKPARYMMIFILKSGGKTAWGYTTQALRNTDYTNLLAQVSTAVA